MIKQYTRFILDSEGNIKHCHSQTLPFEDDYNPVDLEDGETIADCEIEADFDDVEFQAAVGQDLLRGRELIELVEINQSLPQIKPGGIALRNGENMREKLLGLTAKAINVTTVKNEIAEQIRAATDEDEIIAELNTKGRRIKSLEDLPPAALIRALKSITA